jgi:hypothetical protein
MNKLTEDTKLVIKVLRKAISILEKNGWCRHAREYKGRFCALGAIGKARTDLDLDMRYSNTAEGLLKDSLNDSKTLKRYGYIPNVVMFNDDIARDKRYVIRKFKKAVELACKS